MGLVLEMYLVGRDWNQNTDADWQQCGTQEDHPRDRVEGPPGQSMEAEGLFREKAKLPSTLFRTQRQTFSW